MFQKFPDLCPDYHQNLTVSSVAHAPPFASNFVKTGSAFLRNPVNKQTNKQTNKQWKYNFLGGGNKLRSSLMSENVIVMVCLADWRKVQSTSFHSGLSIIKSCYHLRQRGYVLPMFDYLSVRIITQKSCGIIFLKFYKRGGISKSWLGFGGEKRKKIETLP